MYLLIGNYGINCDDFEFIYLFVNGLIVNEICNYLLNFCNEILLNDYLKERNILGLVGIDMRKLMRKIC